MEGSRQLRAARAALFAALCATLSTTSHVLLSRTPLPLPLVGVVFTAMFLIAFATGRRERSLWAIAALMVPLELAADTLFTSGQRTCYGPGGGPVTGPLRSFGVDVICGGGRVGTLLPGDPVQAAVHPALPWALLSAHLAIGLLASWWLRRGETAVQQSLRAAASFAFRPLARAAAVLYGRFTEPQPRVTPAGAAGPRRPPSLTVAHCLVRRGPPRPVVA
ncbi:hypothetical protein POF50_013105 [Streptomyces sp. SL13]|uniref:Integral membrane protein n=1 Tax=Streptantibioticus silvisoli TaxID=2705255 RepID=A0AA90H3V4_9ACTN|nr:hypothetical protein [Streptantibioticus silvisoli]MDI5970270.1 hypothetical protein [Streptantibioticus silvisoli]